MQQAWKRIIPWGIASILLCLVWLPAQANESEIKFDSVMWSTMQQRFFADGPVVFDERVKVMAPASAEDQFNVPVTVDASQLDDVVSIVAVADLNPIPRILEVKPKQAVSFVGFRVKLQQSTPIHVGVKTADGVWHMGGAYVRMTLKMKHPMDTGLAAGIPVFYMSDLQVKDDDGELIADIKLYEPISEDPTLTLKPLVGRKASTLQVSARDTEGNEYAFPLSMPAAVTE